MKCTQCDAEITTGAKFCPECGTAQQVHCPACGQAVAPDAKFCPECGANLNNGGQPQPTGGISVADSVIKGDIKVTDASDHSTHSTTITDSSTTNIGQQFVGSTVNINQSKSRDEEASSALESGTAALRQGGSAIPTLREAIRLSPECPNTNLALGIALLADGHIRKLHHARAEEAERVLSVALNHDATRSAAAEALGALRHCFYMDHSMRQPSPGFDELKATALASQAPTPEQREMLSHMQYCEDYQVDWML